MNNKRSARYLLGGMIGFFILITICVFILPRGLIVNSGISYYGDHLATLVPYSLAFLVSSALLWRTASLMNSQSKLDNCLKFVLKVTAILMIGILITPYNAFNLGFLNYVHRTIGTVMFSTQLVMAMALAIYIYRDWMGSALAMISIFSGFFALVYLGRDAGFMIQAQIVFQLSVWLIYVRYLTYQKPRLAREAIRAARR